MTKQRKKALLAAGTAVAGLVAVAGLAQAGWRDGWGMMGGGMMGGGHGSAMMQQFLDRYDTNKDGKISQEEVDGNRTETFNRFATDKAQGLSLDEFQKLWLEANRRRMVREFQFMDVDGNGKVTLEEYKKPMENIISRMDQNGDKMMGPDDRMGRGHGEMRRMHRWENGGQGQGPGDDNADGGAGDAAPDSQQ